MSTLNILFSPDGEIKRMPYNLGILASIIFACLMMFLRSYFPGKINPDSAYQKQA